VWVVIKPHSVPKGIPQTTESLKSTATCVCVQWRRQFASPIVMSVVSVSESALIPPYTYTCIAGNWSWPEGLLSNSLKLARLGQGGK
jgi:hypothetical protein